MKDEPTHDQLDELEQLSKEARVPDESEIVTTSASVIPASPPVSRSKD